ncbi:MAG TPA: VWA domain-containing protein [Xanthomonadales bacterium]|nr:VWA domain-containing protein [Xanthomonadales bacterium]
MKRILLAATLALAAAPALADDVIVVLDESGSMWGQLGGKAKIESARDAVGALVTRWPTEHRLGLVAYGHRSKGDCNDIETVIPLGAVDEAAFKATVGKLQPKGMTPLSAAVIRAADDLKYTEQKATVLLISDGEETCNLDPCQVGKDLEAKGVDFTAHVIGFDVPNPAHQAQLRCLAENTGGRYFNARDAQELGAALSVAAQASTAKALPPATATLTAPASAGVATLVEVGVEGPFDAGDYVALSTKGSPDVQQVTYAMVERGKAVKLAVPSQPGEYELRYVSPARKDAVLARRALAATDVAASIAAPATVMAGTLVDVVAKGPFEQSHWIGFAPKGSGPDAYLDWKRPTGAESRLQLRAPVEAGEYEIRYVLNERDRILAAKAVTVTQAEATIAAPDAVEQGSIVTVVATGPVADNHWIGFAEKGSDKARYLDWKRPTGPTSTIELKAPATPGDYEIRYVLDENARIAAAKAVVVKAAAVSVVAPASVQAGDTVNVTATGPNAPGHWIGFAPKGSDKSAYLDYKRPTGERSEVALVAPSQPGEYEIRYVLNESEAIAASTPVTVTPTKATIDAPATAVAGSVVKVTATGPVAPGHWIGFAPAGSGPGEYRDYARPTGPTSVFELHAPEEPGSYEIRYVLREGEAVVASKAITVTPAQ